MSAQFTLEERYAIAVLKKRGLTIRGIARELARSPSTISRELSRNRTRHDGAYRYELADSYARTRRSRSRRNTRFTEEDWELVEHLLTLHWSPEQISGWLRLHGILSISHETIYARIWRDKDRGGSLWIHLRQATKRRRKRYGSNDSRGRLAGKRHISERPPEVEGRQVAGHWEIDTIKGDSQAAHSVHIRGGSILKEASDSRITEIHAFGNPAVSLSFLRSGAFLVLKVENVHGSARRYGQIVFILILLSEADRDLSSDLRKIRSAVAGKQQGSHLVLQFLFHIPALRRMRGNRVHGSSRVAFYPFLV
jgi:hypothetical protein